MRSDSTLPYSYSPSPLPDLRSKGKFKSMCIVIRHRGHPLADSSSPCHSLHQMTPTPPPGFVLEFDYDPALDSTGDIRPFTPESSQPGFPDDFDEFDVIRSFLGFPSPSPKPPLSPFFLPASTLAPRPFDSRQTLDPGS